MISVFYGPSGVPNAQYKLDNITAYSHEILSVGGFKSADISFLTTPLDAENWLFTGVGRFVSVYSARGNLVWEGVVNNVSYNMGGRSISVGNLLEVSNRVKIAYQLPKWAGYGGQYRETDWDDNKMSQAKFGILEEIVSGGDGRESEMLRLRTKTLLSKGDLVIGESYSAGGEMSKMLTVTFSCIGVTDLIDRQIYNSGKYDTDEIDLSEKIAIMLAENNSVYLSSALDVEYAGVAVNEFQDNNRTVWSIIKDHITKTANKEEFICGVFNNRMFTLARRDGESTYIRRFGSTEIHDEFGHRVLPSEVTATRDMEILDFSSPVKYRIKSIRYELGGDTVSINYYEKSLAHRMSEMMLGGA